MPDRICFLFQMLVLFITSNDSNVFAYSFTLSCNNNIKFKATLSNNSNNSIVYLKYQHVLFDAAVRSEFKFEKISLFCFL